MKLRNRIPALVSVAVALVLVRSLSSLERRDNTLRMAAENMGRGRYLEARINLARISGSYEEDAYVLLTRAVVEERLLHPSGDENFQQWLHSECCSDGSEFGALDAILEEGISANPRDPVFWEGRAWIAAFRGETKDAIRLISRAVELDPSDFTLHVSEGLMLERLREFARAEEEYALAFSLNPRLLQSRFGSDLLTRDSDLWRGALAKAIARAQSAAKRTSSPTESARLARLLMAEGHVKDAGNLAWRAIVRLPSLQGAWLTFGDFQESNGDFMGIKEL